MRTPKVPKMPKLSRLTYERPNDDLIEQAGSGRRNPAGLTPPRRRKKKTDQAGYPLGNRTTRPHHPQGWDPPRGTQPKKTSSRTGGVAGELYAPSGRHRDLGTAQTSRRGRHRAEEDPGYTGRHRAYTGRHRRD